MRPMKLPALGVVLSGLLLFSSGLPVFAQTALDPDVIKSQTGDWLVAARDGSPGCVLSLKDEETIGGYTVENADDVQRHCRRFPKYPLGILMATAGSFCSIRCAK